jgi:hypothetical protein
MVVSIAEAPTISTTVFYRINEHRCRLLHANISKLETVGG